MISLEMLDDTAHGNRSACGSVRSWRAAKDANPGLCYGTPDPVGGTMVPWSMVSGQRSMGQ
jgi:hypothetical protein